MSAIVDKFGQIVEGRVLKNPEQALALLKAGYLANGKQMKYMPDKTLLPHQKYVSVISNQAILAPLLKPQDSAVVSVFFPCEFLHAFNIVPQFTEGLAGYLNGARCEHAFVRFAEDMGIPQTYCSYHKILIGAVLSGVIPKPRFVMNTTLACDANNNTFRTLSDYWGVPHFTLDVPDKNNEDTVAYVVSQLRELKIFLEEAMDKRLHYEELINVVRRENRCGALYREYFQELSVKYIPNNMTSEMYKIFMTHVLNGTEEAYHYFELMLEDARAAEDSDNEIRILWAHTLPFWQDSIKSKINHINFDSRKHKTRVQLLSCDLNFDFMQELNEAHPYEALAEKLLCNSMGGIDDRRTEKLLDAAKKLHADGVVYFCHWGCKQTLGNSFAAKERLESEGIPTLILDGDGCDCGNVNDGQMSTRLQAFLEILEARK